jgi:hypothetical protein
MGPSGPRGRLVCEWTEWRDYVVEDSMCWVVSLGSRSQAGSWDENGADYSRGPLAG